MKKSLVIITLLLVLVSAFSVNALVTKRSATWGFAMKVTGMAAADAVCSDSDNSTSYDMAIYSPTIQQRPDAFVLGVVNYAIPSAGLSGIYKDSCYDDTHMAEQFCQQGKYKGVQGLTCANGCSNGACLINPIITPPSQTCTDSDNGVNYSVAGQITGTYNGNNFTWPDYCNNETTLYEMYCGGPNSSSPSFNIHTCPNGCSNSACLPPLVITPGCHDVEAEFHIGGQSAPNLLKIQLNSAVVFIVNNVEYLVNFTNINNNNATFLVNGQQISLMPPRAEKLANGVSFKLLGLNNTPVCGSDGRNYESACLAGAAGAAVSCSGQCPCPPPVCSDSDNGINTSVKGYVKAGFGGGSDCCVTPSGKGGCAQNGTHVMELYCSPNSPNGFDTITLPCPNGCQDGACVAPIAIVGPAPVPITSGEQVTCQFLFAKSTQTCSSPKGRCSAPRNNPKCTIQVSGTPGEKINWTSTCGTPAVVTTTIDATNENAVFVCGSFRVPNIRFP